MWPFALLPLLPVVQTIIVTSIILPYYIICLFLSSHPYTLFEVIDASFVLAGFVWISVFARQIQFDNILRIEKEKEKNNSVAKEMEILSNEFVTFEKQENLDYKFTSKINTEVNTIANNLNHLVGRLKELTDKDKESSKYRGIAV